MRLLRGVAAAGLLLGVFAGTVFALTAFSYHLADLKLLAACALALAASALAIARLWQGRSARAWAIALSGLALFTLWWAALAPSADRDWAADVTHGVVARRTGAQVTLHNVRDFDWRAENEFTARWRSMNLDLDQLVEVEMFTSVWSSPAIAHLLTSFGFADGQRIVFSVEVRRERTEEWSQLGGFFKQFELVLIGATEWDILRLRTDVRGESVSRYPLQLDAGRRRALLLSFVDLADDLASKPRWYNTLLTNCTTMVFRLARMVEPGIPLDWRILLSGYLPDYLYDNHVIDRNRPLERIRAEALIRRPAAPPADEDYSSAIRSGLIASPARQP